MTANNILTLNNVWRNSGPPEKILDWKSQFCIKKYFLAEQNHFRTTNIFGGKKHFCTKHHYWANKFIGRKKIGQTFLAENVWPNIFGRKCLAKYIWPKMFGRIFLTENVWPNIFGRKCLAEYSFAKIIFWSKIGGIKLKTFFRFLNHSRGLCQKCRSRWRRRLNLPKIDLQPQINRPIITRSWVERDRRCEIKNQKEAFRIFRKIRILSFRNSKFGRTTTIAAGER